MTPIDEHLAAPQETRPARHTAPVPGLVGSTDTSVPVIQTDAGVTTIVFFATSNLDLARLLDQADDRVVCLERMLAIGAAAMLSAGLQLDTAVVERRFDDLNVRFDASIRGAFESIGGLLDADDGTIACALDDVKAEIAAVINSTFDPTKTTSAPWNEIQARVNSLVRRGATSVYLVEPDCGRDDYCLVISDQPLTEEEAAERWDRWFGGLPEDDAYDWAAHDDPEPG